MFDENKIYTTASLCKECNISRDIFKRYKQAGLIKETSRDKHGHLLFNEEAVTRVRFIRFFHCIGVNIPEIKLIIDKPISEIRSFLKSINNELNNQQELVKNSLITLEEMLEANSIEELIEITISK